MNDDEDETRDGADDDGGEGVRVAAAVLVRAHGEPRYERGAELARGGLGRVTLGRDLTLQREVAIKELHERSQRGVHRFVHEGLTTARLQHPAIVPVLDAGTWDTGDPYLVMKLLEGKTLAEELATRTTTEARLALVPNLLAIADALGYAHAQGVVHRDVKPSNIMLGAHGETVLLDWGLAYDRTAVDVEPDRELAGTVRYMCPEQARNEPPSPAFDVFSLGATLATVLAGRVPFDEVSGEVIVARLRAGEPAIPALPAAVPPDLVAIIDKATARAGRYVDGAALAEDLRRFIAGQLVGARRYSRAQLLARWIRRHRVIVALAGAAAIAVAVTAAIAVRSVVRERNLAVARRAEAEARELELVLLQARAHLRTDPTATIAWLKRYPVTAPHQDEVLALVDEAAGRGIARHVWRAPAAPTDVAFAPDGGAVSAAYASGELWRADLATGAFTSVAKSDHPLVVVRPRGDAVFALDHEGTLWRWSTEGVMRHATVRVPSRPTGLFLAGGDLKVTFVDDPAVYIPVDRPGAPRSAPVSPGFEDAFVEDENNAVRTYLVSRRGVLAIQGDPPRPLWTFAPGTWVRSSDNGEHYVALAADDDRVTIWAGSSAGPPTQLASSAPACQPGENRDRSADITDDGRFVALERCGVLTVYDVASRQRLALDAPERIRYFDFSRDAGWLAVARTGGGVEVVDLEHGEVRVLAGTTVAITKFSPASRMLLSVGTEQGLRVWPLTREPRIQLGRQVAATRLSIPTRSGELAIHRHLTCTVWRTTELDRVVTVTAPAAAIRQGEDEALLWAWHASEDARTCVFAGVDGTALIVAADGSTRTLRDDDELVDCVVAGASVTCRTSRHLVTYDLATGRSLARRDLEGTPRGLVRSRGEPVVLVERARDCALETVAGRVLATVPAGCRAAEATPGAESAIVVRRVAGVDVWTAGTAVVSFPYEDGLVAAAPSRPLVAVARQRSIEIWDPRTRVRRAGPDVQPRTITALAWSSTGVLASVDDETVRVWDPDTGTTRVMFSERVMSIAWAPDGRTLYTTDGRSVRAWQIDLDRDASPAAVRSRLDALTSARIVDGQVATP